jgi:hypothetical protein
VFSCCGLDPQVLGRHLRLVQLQRTTESLAGGTEVSVDAAHRQGVQHLAPHDILPMTSRYVVSAFDVSPESITDQHICSAVRMVWEGLARDGDLVHNLIPTWN